MAPDSEPTPRVPWLPVSEGVDPEAPEAGDELGAFQPIVPAWIQRDEPTDQPANAQRPTSAVEPPAAAEVLPAPGTEPTAVYDAPPVAPHADAVQLLGESAVASAALSAAGAPTPLGGVPVTPAAGAVTPPDFGAPGAFIPAFEDDIADQTPTKADALAAGIVAHEQERLASQATALDGGVAYTPRAFSEPAAEPAPVIVPQPEPQGGEETKAPPPSGRSRHLWWLWILLAVLVLAGLGVTYALLNRPAAKVVPGVTVTQPPPTPTIVPSPLPTATAFQSSMPATVGTYALVSAVPLDPADVALSVGRIADGVDLTYRSGDDTMHVRALQYFNEDDAKTMFTQLAGADTATQPVEANGTNVGESAIITAPKPGMVWRNGTSVFVLTGPPLQVSDFYQQFGL